MLNPFNVNISVTGQSFKNHGNSAFLYNLMRILKMFYCLPQKYPHCSYFLKKINFLLQAKMLQAESVKNVNCPPLILFLFHFMQLDGLGVL